MLTMGQIRKAAWPPPVYVAHHIDGTYTRMSFYSPAGKPLDFERGRLIARQVAYGRQIIAGHVEIQGEIVAYDPMTSEIKRRRGPSSKLLIEIIKDLLADYSEETRKKAEKAIA